MDLLSYSIGFKKCSLLLLLQDIGKNTVITDLDMMIHYFENEEGWRHLEGIDWYLPVNQEHEIELNRILSDFYYEEEGEDSDDE